MANVPLSSALPIAMVMTSFDPGGTERQMIELVRRLDRQRWAVHVACFHTRGAWFDRVREAAASVATFPVTSFSSPATLRHLWAFASWCRAQRIALVHTTELYSNIFGLPGAALAGVPVRVGNRREINPDKSLAQIAMQRAAYSFAHTIVANSHAAADRLLAERIPSRKVAVVPNGLDVQPFQPRRRAARLRKVIVVANLRREKGHDVLIDAAPAILHRFPDARFELVGGGIEQAALTARAAERGVLGAFSFAGHCEDVANRLADADIFVLPTRSDASPNAVVEAMAAGLPIVVSDVDGVSELIEDGRSGLLVPPDSPRALAQTLCQLMADPSAASRLGAAARQRALARHSFERMVAAFEGVYLSELARAGSRRSLPGGVPRVSQAANPEAS